MKTKPKTKQTFSGAYCSMFLEVRTDGLIVLDEYDNELINKRVSRMEMRELISGLQQTLFEMDKAQLLMLNHDS